jgi:hypothetical protein
VETLFTISRSRGIRISAPQATIACVLATGRPLTQHRPFTPSRLEVDCDQIARPSHFIETNARDVGDHTVYPCVMVAEETHQWPQVSDDLIETCRLCGSVSLAYKRCSVRRIRAATARLLVPVSIVVLMPVGHTDWAMFSFSSCTRPSIGSSCARPRQAIAHRQTWDVGR